MPDLYDVLGIARGASRAEIRAAYRKSVKTAHPDAGGSVRAFALVKRAHDILSDAARRQKYDATGDDAEIQPDNMLGNALQVLHLALDKVLQQCMERRREPTEVDLIEMIKAVIDADISEASKSIFKMREVRKVDEKLAMRFSKKRKKKGQEDASPVDVFDHILRGRLAMLDQQIVNLNNQVENRKKALQLCGDYVYRKDDAPCEQTKDIWVFPYAIFGGMC